jgi:hypothetical protein
MKTTILNKESGHSCPERSINVARAGVSALLIGLMFAVVSRAADHGSDPPSSPKMEAGRPLMGGYSKADIKDERVRKAAEFSVLEKTTKSSKLVLVEIMDAQQQVVAGMNYRLHLKLTDDGKEKEADAVVYLKLDGTMSLTTWEWK